MPKKLILFFIGCLCSLMSIAQIQKGTVVTHFNIGDLHWLGAGKTNFSFNPGVGYFIKDNWEIGTTLNYHRFNSGDHSPIGIKENGHTIGVNAYTNYYFGKGKLKPYLTFQLGWQRSNWDVTMSGITNHYNQNYLTTAIGGGLNWQVRPRVSLFAEATYRREIPFNNWSHGYGSAYITVGVRFLLNQKKKH